jgi:predicted TIM-barrel fold metal-dependent hydrolase
MKFFDCNASLGLSARGQTYSQTNSITDFITEMDFNGVEQALVWNIAQLEASPFLGNELVANSIRDQPRLFGCWTILPNQAREFPPFDVFLEKMHQARIYTLRTFPNDHHFFLNSTSMDSWLGPMVKHKVPLFISVERGGNWDIVYSLMNEYPELVCVLCDHGCWGEDRRFRPLIERYPSMNVETSKYLLDGGIEAFVADYGFDRLLYGSGFPGLHFGGMMMAIKHARISEQAKEAIAGNNLERILSEVRW